MIGTDIVQDDQEHALLRQESVHSSTTSTQAPDGDLTARTTETYGYDAHGQLTSDQVGWASGAAPPENGGGPAAPRTYATTLSADQLTRSIAVTVGAGTTDAATTTTVVDQVSGQPVQVTDGVGRVATRTYDAAARRHEVQPTGLVTTTAYTRRPGQTAIDHRHQPGRSHRADHVRRRRAGHEDQRNVAAPKPGAPVAFTSDPTARTTSSFCYGTLGADGCDPPQSGTLTATDKAGRTTVTTYDALNRPITKTGPTGITYATTYDDVANAAVSQTFADGVDRLDAHPDDQHQVRRARPSGLLADHVPDPWQAADVRQRPVAADQVRLARATGRRHGPRPDDGARLRRTRRCVPSTTVSPAGSNPVQSDADHLHRHQRPRHRRDGERPRPGGQHPGRDHRHLRRRRAGGHQHRPQRQDHQLRVRRRRTADHPDDAERHHQHPELRPDDRAADLGRREGPDGTTTTTSYTYVPNGQVGAGMVASVTNESGTITYGYDADRNRVSVSYPDGSTTSERVRGERAAAEQHRRHRGDHDLRLLPRQLTAVGDPEPGRRQLWPRSRTPTTGWTG